MSPLKPAVDLPARSDVCNVENLGVNGEDYAIVADACRSLVGTGQRF
jgi:hypothetical protein